MKDCGEGSLLLGSPLVSVHFCHSWAAWPSQGVTDRRHSWLWCGVVSCDHLCCVSSSWFLDGISSAAVLATQLLCSPTPAGLSCLPELDRGWSVLQSLVVGKLWYWAYRQPQSHSAVEVALPWIRLNAMFMNMKNEYEHREYAQKGSVLI